MFNWLASLPLAQHKKTTDRLFRSRSPFMEALEERCVPDANGNFVSSAYQALLGRAADATGMSVFSNALANNQLSRTQVVQDIESSPEFQQRVVTLVYQQFLGRTPDTSGLQNWTNYLAQGNSQIQLEAQILGSQEYFQKNGGTNQGFLTAIYRDVLHRNIDTSGQQSFTTALNNGLSRTQVAQIILDSSEAINDFANAQYTGLLHRTADTGGLNGFTNALSHNNNSANTNGSNTNSSSGNTNSSSTNGSNSNNGGSNTNGSAVNGSATQHGMTEEQVTAAIVASQEFFNNAQATTAPTFATDTPLFLAGTTTTTTTT
jgi:hypothetical protein